jgi:parallel beta-helix repeat protein
VNLCENQVFQLSSNQCQGPSALCYKKPGQRVYTNNFPDAETGTSSAAVLVVNGDDVRSIIYGELSGTLLRSVVLDGNRRTFGQHPANAWATVEVGAAVGQRVEHVLIRDTRTWSSLHIFEGRLTCTGAVVAHVRVEDAGCDIHGNGCERDDRVGTWADGISYSCRNGVVRDNVVENATDGGIVLFAPAGTEVFNNTVTAVDRVMLGGINMVDDGPFRITVGGTVYGDFSGVKVHHNTIAALGSRIDVGIGQGPRIWFCDDRYVNYGASVTDNLFTGAFMGWGAAIDGVRNWTFDGNTFAATHSGPSIQGCGDLPVPAPTDCRRHPEHAAGTGVFQAECAAVAPGHALHGILLSNQIR